MLKYRNCNQTAALEFLQQAAVLLTSDRCDCQAVGRGRTLPLLRELRIRSHPKNTHKVITGYCIVHKYFTITIQH